MASSLGSAWRSFWHTMTSNDRHASHDSPYRTGQHVPLSQNRHDPLTSVATNADESRVNISAPAINDNVEPVNPYLIRTDSAPSPATTPYSPGLRSLQRKDSGEPNPLSRSNTGEIQMQNFNDGLPPPPPVTHSWKRIDRWAEDNYEELYDNLSEPCTQNDINELEHELDCTLPQDVRDSLQVHDGQEHGGRPTGIIFGCMLLDCEEIVQEWKNWRLVNEELLSKTGVAHISEVPNKTSSVASSSSNPPPPPPTDNSMWREELLSRQDSQPPNAIQKAYVHPAWIPLARDWGGNNLAIDLAPGSAGKWGQVILMGRDYDCKYVVARSWAAFLATVADDLSTGRAYVDEETMELKLREFKGLIEPGYFDILRWRSDQKYGRRPPPHRKQSANGEMRANPNIPPSGPQVSPYASPARESERSRSPQKFSGKGIATSSPRGSVASSPLARVAEEMPPLQTHGVSKLRQGSIPSPEKLISPLTSHSVIDTPTTLEETQPSINGGNKENERDQSVATPQAEIGNGNGAINHEKADDNGDEMKTVEI